MICSAVYCGSWRASSLKKYSTRRGAKHGALFDAGVALEIRTGGDAAHDDLDRDHLATAHDHLVAVFVFAAAEIVGRQTARVEQPVDARRRQRGEAAFALDGVALRAVARGDAVLRRRRSPRPVDPDAGRALWSCRARLPLLCSSQYRLQCQRRRCFERAHFCCEELRPLGREPRMCLRVHQRSSSAGSMYSANAGSAAMRSGNGFFSSRLERFPRPHRHFSQSLVQCLAVRAPPRRGHQDRLRAGERPETAQVPRDAPLVDAQSAHDLVRQRDELVGGQERSRR